MANIQSKLIYGTRQIPAITVWIDEQGIGWIHQNGFDTSYEAWMSCFDGEQDMPRTTLEQKNAIHDFMEQFAN